MSAETLRRAAALMRERAEAVPAGPWEKEFSDVIRTDVPFGADGYLIAESATVERATHIASWHPAVALAVADVFDALAARAEGIIEATPTLEFGERVAVSNLPGYAAAVVAARAYLGESA